MSARRRQHGFLIIAAIFLLVVLAGLALYFATVTTTSQASSASDLNSARAYQAARAGAEWAIYRILNPDGVASHASSLETLCSTTTLTPVTRSFVLPSTLSGFTVSVTCESAPFTEGATSLRTYAIEATACNEPKAPPEPLCPNSATRKATYVERKVSLTVTK